MSVLSVSYNVQINYIYIIRNREISRLYGSVISCLSFYITRHAGRACNSFSSIIAFALSISCADCNIARHGKRRKLAKDDAKCSNEDTWCSLAILQFRHGQQDIIEVRQANRYRKRWPNRNRNFCTYTE